MEVALQAQPYIHRFGFRAGVNNVDNISRIVGILGLNVAILLWVRIANTNDLIYVTKPADLSK